MGWFNKTVTLTEYELADAKRIIGLDPHTTVNDEEMWRLRMGESSLPDMDKYLVGHIKNEGTAVAVIVGKQRVGQLDDRALPSAVQVLRKHGGQTAPCIVSQVNKGWNVYVNMA
jgi:hypothetical protein